MSEPKTDDWVIYQGRTFKRVVRWETEPVVYKPITAVSQAAPVAITASGHGLKSGWYAAVTDVKGMTEINAQSNAPKASDYHQVTVSDVDTITINDINAAGFSAYKSGGYLRYNTPVDITGAVVRANIRDRVGGTLLLSLSTVTGEIVLDTVNHTISITIPATVTQVIGYTKGVYDLEAAIGTEVTVLTVGSVNVIPEITTE